MQQYNQQFKEQLERYRRGASDQLERSRIFRWLIRLDLFGPIAPELIVEKQRQSAAGLRKEIFPEPELRHLNHPMWIRTAAAILLLLGALWMWQYQWDQPSDTVKWAQMSTGAGEMKKVTLGDGSEIVLNAMSSLSYPVKFAAGKREVRLTGQGFFTVSHNPSKPFRVETGRISVQVLGTSFDVRAYADDAEILVEVATGKVGVLENGKNGSKPRFLTPGQGLSYKIASGVFISSTLEPKDAGSWQQRKISFSETPLVTITKELERQYKVKFIYKDTRLKDKPLSLNVRNQRIETIMQGLSISGEFKYKIEKGTITIMPM